MRNALIDRQLQHLGINHNEPHVGGCRVVEQAEHHGVDGHGFARTGGSGHQQVGHTGQVDHHGVTADVLPERQCERGIGMVVLLGLQQLAQADDFPVLIGHFQADNGLARNDFHHAHTHRGQRPGQVLGQVRNLADLHARRRLQLESRDHGSRVHGHHLHLNAEVPQLHLYLLGHGLERGTRETGLRRIRGIE